VIVLDTDYVSLLQHERGKEREEILRLLEADGRPIATTIITIDE
jgi:hypothetical protein